MDLLEQIKRANRVVNVLQPLREMFLDLEKAIEEELEEEAIIDISYSITYFIQKNNVTPDEEIQTLEMVGAFNPMSMLSDWYVDTQYRSEVK